MENLPLLGPAAPEEGWVPAPRYLLRRDRIVRALAQTPACRVLEIGCGPAMLLQELTAKGFECHGLETSEAARKLAARLAGRAGHNIQLYAEPSTKWGNQFPLLMAFEVLEHIEEDRQALMQWWSWLAPGGRLLLSVPAHQSRWNARDVWAGHVQRYERRQLTQLFQDAGFEVESMECYGFPLANVLEHISARRYAKHDRVQSVSTNSTRDANTAQSGIDRSSDMKWYPLLRSLPGRTMLAAAIQAQRPFLDTEWGNGYVVTARKP